MAIRRSSPIWTVLVLPVIASLIFVVSDSSFAQERKKIAPWLSKGDNTKISGQQAFQIPNMDGHVMRIAEFRRTWPDGGGPVIEGQKVAEEITHGFVDLIAGNGHGFGYSTWRFDNGDLMFGEFQNAIQTVVNSDRTRKTTFVGTYVTTGGTGRLKGIKGLGRFSGTAELDAEGKTTRNEVNGGGEYWFEK